MNADVTANSTDLQSTAPQYSDVADRVRQIYQTLTQALDTLGACWGDDASGRTFGGKYCPPAVSAIAQMSNTNQGVQSMVDGICVWAKNYLNVDQSTNSDASGVYNNSTSVDRNAQ
jgi:uncharacterized protein YukE